MPSIDDVITARLHPTKFPSFLKVLLEDGLHLTKECVSFTKQHELPPPQVTLRSFIRAAFAFIEGGVALLKAVTLHSLLHRLGPAEIVALSDYTCDIGENGAINPRPTFRPVERRFLLICNLLRHHHEMSISIDVKSEEWKRFAKCRRVRNRITHPKTPDDLAITSEDYYEATQTFTWFAEIATSIFEQITTRYNEMDLEEIRRVLQNNGVEDDE